MVDLKNDNLDEMVLLKAMIKGGAALVPGGGIIGGIVDALWPSKDDSMKVWNHLSAYAQAMCHDMIDKYVLTAGVQKELEGLQSDLDIYNHSTGSQKANQLDTLPLLVANRAPQFFNKDKPRLTLPWFVPMGSIHLAVLNEQAFRWSAVKGSPDDNHLQHCQDLRDAAARYLNALVIMKNDCLKYRLDCVEEFDRKEIGLEEGYTLWHTRVRDVFPNETWEITLNSSESQADLDNQRDAAMAGRRSDVLPSYQEGVEKLCGPADEWPAFQSAADKEMADDLIRRTTIDIPV